MVKLTPDALAWLLVLVHLCATLFMTGLIWFVQVVHYPLKSSVGEESFVGYQARHVTLTGWVVGPPMLIEAATALILALSPPRAELGGVALVGLALLIAIWGATALASVPAHGRLARGFDEVTHRWLVRTNWIRTWGWSLRGGLSAWMVLLMSGVTLSP